MAVCCCGNQPCLPGSLHAQLSQWLGDFSLFASVIPGLGRDRGDPSARRSGAAEQIAQVPVLLGVPREACQEPVVRRLCSCSSCSLSGALI